MSEKIPYRFSDLLSRYKKLEREYEELKKAKECLEEDGLTGQTAHALIKSAWGEKAKELRRFDNQRFVESEQGDEF